MSSGDVSKEGSSSGFEPPWYYAGEEAGLKEGKLLRVEAGGKEVLLIKNEGQVYAFSNICPHARCPLDRGRLEDFTLICICHGRRFDIRTGECLNDTLDLKKYEARIESGKIGVKLEK